MTAVQIIDYLFIKRL